MRASKIRRLLLFILLSCGIVGCSILPSESSGPSIYEAPKPQEGNNPFKKISAEHIYESVRDASGHGPDQQKARDIFAQAEKEFKATTELEGKQRKKAFAKLADDFLESANRWPESALEEDALYMYGESLFFADLYPRAAKAYEQLIKKFPNTRHFDVVDSRRFNMARYWLEIHKQDPKWVAAPNITQHERPRFDTYGHALRTFNRIRLDDPTGKLADDATMAAGNAQFKAQKYAQADELFSDLRRSFPQSEHQFQAHLLGLRSKMMTYQGPSYDGNVLDDCIDLIKQMRRQFPEDSREHGKYLKTAYKEIRMNQAMREWEMAQYFDRRKEYDAARQYYTVLVEDFPDTSLSEDASKRLTDIADQPGKPETQLAWLTKLFPTPERDKPLLANVALERLKR